MDITKQQSLSKLLTGAVAAVGYELWGYEYFPRGKASLLRVYIESKKGITIDDCAAASRQISAVLEVEDPIVANYTLEVSSPGLDRPLFILAHYQSVIGAKIKIRLYQPRGDRRNYAGTLVKADDAVGSITLEVDDKALQFALSDIEKARVCL